jgi:hypothetical protein
MIPLVITTVYTTFFFITLFTLHSSSTSSFAEMLIRIKIGAGST